MLTFSPDSKLHTEHDKFNHKARFELVILSLNGVSSALTNQVTNFQNFLCHLSWVECVFAM